MPTCLVTGGAGFIGSHLVEGLVAAGWRVKALDNFSTGKLANLAGVADWIEIIACDILNRPLLDYVMRGVEVVFHLAAKVSVPQSVAEPEMFHQVCAGGTLEVLMAARAAGVRRVVYAASGSAYGNTALVPTPESAPLHPLSPYAAAKLAGEHYCEAFAETSKLETVRLRYFNVFGPRQDPSSPYSGVISIFCTQLLAGQRPTIHGDGRQTRDFVAVADVVQANLKAAVAQKVNGQVFNIGRGERVTILNLWETLRRQSSSMLEPEFGPPRAGDVLHSQADITAARKLLGYEPAVSFEAGLARCLDHYQSHVV